MSGQCKSLLHMLRGLCTKRSGEPTSHSMCAARVLMVRGCRSSWGDKHCMDCSGQRRTLLLPLPPLNHPRVWKGLRWPTGPSPRPWADLTSAGVSSGKWAALFKQLWFLNSLVIFSPNLMPTFIASFWTGQNYLNGVKKIIKTTHNFAKSYP